MLLDRILRRTARSHRRGQALVEMAIILPVLLLVLLLGLDLGRVFFGWVGLNNASRIGASYAAAHPTAWGTPGNSTQRANYEAQILADASALNCVLPGTLPTPVFSAGTDLGDPAQVTLTCQFTLITPLVSQIVGGSITIRAEAVFPIRGGFIGGVPVGSTLPSPSPGGSPSPTPDPSATPAPTPAECSAPSFIGDRINPNSALQTKWEQAGFTTTLVISGGGNQRVASQSPLVGGQRGPCDTTIESVGP
jgi:Flp pilus assembly protein TadG